MSKVSLPKPILTLCKRVFTNKFLLFSIFFLIFAFSVKQLSTNIQAQGAEPNIVTILVDDLDQETFQQMLAQNLLPNIKSQLIDKGVTFDNSFVVDSQCCPSRATLLTGKYSHNTGVTSVVGYYGGTEAFVRNNNSNNLAIWLKNGKNYRTGWIGKFTTGLNVTHVSPGNPNYLQGWDTISMTDGYDGRPGMYHSLKNIGGGQIGIQNKYVTKHINDDAVGFINSATSPFFLVVAPPIPHVGNPRWVDTGMVFNTGQVVDGANPSTNDTDPISAWSQFRTETGQTIQQAVKGTAAKGYTFYSRTKDDPTVVNWGNWQNNGNMTTVLSGIPNLSGSEVSSFTTFLLANTNGSRVQQVILKDSGGTQTYYQRILGGTQAAPNWLSTGTKSSILPVAGSDPLAGWGAVELPDGARMQNALVGSNNTGYYNHQRFIVNGAATAWKNTTDSIQGSTIMTGNETYVGGALMTEDTAYNTLYFPHLNKNANILRQQILIARDVNGQTVYRLYTHDESLFHLGHFSSSVLGASTDEEVGQTIPLIYEDEGSMYNSVAQAYDFSGDINEVLSAFGIDGGTAETSVVRMDAIASISNYTLPHPYFAARIYAEGNWENIESGQTLSSTLPAGTLRSGGNPNAYSPSNAQNRPPALTLSKPSQNNDGANKTPWIQSNWQDFNSGIYDGRTLQDYANRLHLDRVETMRSVDTMVGNIINQLSAKGVLNNSVIIFASDNGHLLGEFRLGNKKVAYDESTRVPMIIRTPETSSASRTDANLVANIDIAPTVLEFAGLDPYSSSYDVDGRSLRNLVDQVGVTVGIRDWLLVEQSYPQLSNGSFSTNFLVDWAWGVPNLGAIRSITTADTCTIDGGHLYVEYWDDPSTSALEANSFSELYAMDTDQFQMNNVVNDAAYATQKSVLVGALSGLKSCGTAFGASCRDADMCTVTEPPTPTPTGSNEPTPTPTVIPTTQPTPTVVPTIPPGAVCSI